MLRGSRIWIAGLSICAVAAGFAGCGGDEEGSAAEGPRFSVANEPPGVFIRRTAKLLATTKSRKDCDELATVNGQSTFRFSCPPERRLRESMRNFDVVGVETYGTGAVVDYKSGRIDQGAAILLFVAPNRGWGISRFGVLTEPSTNTSDEDSREGYDQAVDAYLAAIRDRDCPAFERVAFISEENRKNFCKKRFPGTKALAKRLKTNPSAGPRYLGGNGTYGFYSLEMAKPDPLNLTISVVGAEVDGEPKYEVLNLAPSPTEAERRRIVREFRRQQREAEKAPTGMETSPGSTNRLPDADE